MGFGSSTPDVPSDDIPTYDVSSVQDLQRVSIAPVTGSDVTLYTPSGKQCCWQDSAAYAFRLRQLEIMNYAISVLSKQTWKTADKDFLMRVHSEVLTYRDIDGNVGDNHDWSLLADDTTFTPLGFRTNKFRDFADYFQTHGGASKDAMITDFDEYLTIFMRIRDGLMKIIANQCSQVGGSRRGNIGRGYGSVQRRRHY